jgi:hypothetical protein
MFWKEPKRMYIGLHSTFTVEAELMIISCSFCYDNLGQILIFSMEKLQVQDPPIIISSNELNQMAMTLLHEIKGNATDTQTKIGEKIFY